MLKRRVATALVTGGLAIVGVGLLPPLLLVLTGAAVVLVAAWEWSRLAGCPIRAQRIVYVIAVALLVFAALWFGSASVRIWLGGAIACWLAVSVWLIGGGGPRPSPARNRWIWLAIGAVFLPPLALAIALFAQHPDSVGRWLLLYALGIVWVADMGAFFTGRTWGRHKLAPRLSAGKTREGLAGGLAAVALYAALGAWLFAIPASAWAVWMALALFAGALSVVGDLFESVLKREAGVKDSGTLLPGHGGLLDRIDGLIAATPAMVLGLALINGVGFP